MEPNYDFIMNAGSGGKKSFLSGNSQKQRIIIVLGIATILIVVAIIASNIIGASSKTASNNLIDLAAYQSELKRIIAIGAEKSRDAGVKSKAVTAKYVLESDYQASIKLMNARGIKPPQDFATRYSSKTLDTQLDEADKSNNFDSEYTTLYNEKLTNYKAKLSEVYPSLNPNEQAVLKQQNNNAKILLGEPLEEQTN